jgi:hypothetical protein
VIGDEEAPLRENVITALLGALDEELAGLVTDIARVRDSVKVVSALWQSGGGPKAVEDGS